MRIFPCCEINAIIYFKNKENSEYTNYKVNNDNNIKNYLPVNFVGYFFLDIKTFLRLY